MKGRTMLLKKNKKYNIKYYKSKTINDNNLLNLYYTNLINC